MKFVSIASVKVLISYPKPDLFLGCLEKPLFGSHDGTGGEIRVEALKNLYKHIQCYTAEDITSLYNKGWGLFPLFLFYKL